MVCEQCQDVLLARGETVYCNRSQKMGSDFVHHKSFDSLIRAVKIDRCSLCHGLWNSLSPEARQIVMEKKEEFKSRTKGDGVSYGWVSQWASDQYTLYLTLQTFSRDVGNVEYRATYELRLETNLGPMSGFKNLNRGTTSITNTKAAAIQWLEHCNHNHQTCNNDFDRNGWNPSRVLDVTPNSNSSIRLIETSASTRPLTYATLSHRWGKAEFYQLNAATESELKSGLTLSKLPKTFRDAVEVARALGIVFLWIDSLCIKQDDQADWLCEASLMHKVYRLGQVNISATAALEPADGLFVERDHVANGHMGVELATRSSTIRCTAFDKTLWTRNVSNAPLNKRGWVLQERILSKRVLHFGRDQLFWECHESSACETFLQGLPNAYKPDTFKRWVPLALDSESHAVTSAEENSINWEALNIWKVVVEAYSKCSFTFPGDKMIAIMGVAKQMRAMIGDVYVAGMWRKTLASSLSWSVAFHTEGSLVSEEPRLLVSEESRCRSRTYVAPSWSWMSLNTAVSYPYSSDYDDLQTSIKDVHLDYATEDKMGALTGGHLYLEGILRRIQIHRQTQYTSRYHSSAWKISLPCGRRIGSAKIDVPPDDPDGFSKEFEADLLFCMDLVDNTLYRSWRSLLLRCENRETGVFSRVGLCTAWEKDRHALIDIEENATREEDLPCVSRNAETGLYTICIM